MLLSSLPLSRTCLGVAVVVATRVLFPWHLDAMRSRNTRLRAAAAVQDIHLVNGLPTARLPPAAHVSNIFPPFQPHLAYPLPVSDATTGIVAYQLPPAHFCRTNVLPRANAFARRNARAAALRCWHSRAPTCRGNSTAPRRDAA